MVFHSYFLGLKGDSGLPGASGLPGDPGDVGPPGTREIVS